MNTVLLMLMCWFAANAVYQASTLLEKVIVIASWAIMSFIAFG